MLHNVKIGKKLIMAFVWATIISSVSGAIGAIMLLGANNDYSEALVNYGFASGKIAQLGMQVQAGSASIRDIVFLTDQEDMKNAVEKVDAAAAMGDQLIKEIEPTNVTPESQALFAAIKKDLEEYRVIRKKVAELGLANNQTSAHSIWTKQASPKIDSMVKNIEELIALNLTAGERVSADLKNQATVSYIVIISVILAGLVVSIILGMVISRDISKPIIEIEHAAKQMAKGILSSRINYRSKNELGSLAENIQASMNTVSGYIKNIDQAMSSMANGNFNIQFEESFMGDFSNIEQSIESFTQKMSETLSQVHVASDQVLSGSNQVSGAAQALSKGATEQASSVEELSASINEIAHQVTENATNANSVNYLAGVVGEKIDDSNLQMNNMLEAMSEISSSSAQIRKIIKSIEDISFQTNILALNAAVEAARAGAAGKGFAVVADEVRSLANKSSEAAKLTSDLIESSVISVQKGQKIADQTACSLSQVVEGADKIIGLISKITVASSDQSVSIAQINLGVEQISAVIQTNSATSEQTAAAAEELSSQSTMLNQLISRFKLKRGCVAEDVIVSQATPYTTKSLSSSPKKQFSLDSNIKTWDIDRLR